MSQAFWSGTVDMNSELCGSDEWQIDLHESEPLVTDLFEHLRMQ